VSRGPSQTLLGLTISVQKVIMFVREIQMFMGIFLKLHNLE
jgi:hypothetical protein